MKNVFFGLGLSAVVGTALIAPSAVNAQSIVLDTFDDGEVDLSAPKGGGFFTVFTDFDAGLTGVLGGSRLTTLSVDACNFAPDECGEVELNIAGSGVLDVALGARVFGNTASVEIGYDGFLIEDLRDYDLVLTGFNFDQTAVDATTFEVEITSDAGTFVFLGDLMSDFDEFGTGTLTQDFSTLTELEGSNVTALSFKGTTSEASDYILDRADLVKRDVPEASFILGLLGVGAFFITRKRQTV